MTVETALNNILLEVGLDITSPQITSTDYAIRQIRQFMNAAGKDIAARAEWAGLFKAATATGSAETLPTDFGKMPSAGDAYTVEATPKPINAVTSPELWAFLQDTPSADSFYHIRGGEISFSPALPTGGATFSYISTGWANGLNEIVQNSDKFAFPDRLVELGTIWRWKRQKGFPFDDYISELEADLEAAIAADRGAA